MLRREPEKASRHGRGRVRKPPTMTIARATTTASVLLLCLRGPAASAFQAAPTWTSRSPRSLASLMAEPASKAEPAKPPLEREPAQEAPLESELPNMKDMGGADAKAAEALQLVDAKKRTLYQILGASPEETRDQLKKRYIQLAKISHPDARIANAAASDVVFTDVAAAWQVLGDAKARRKYDRTLRAEEFSEYAQKFANDRLEKAVPAVSQILDKVAVPFLRRTTATTWAVAQAAAKGMSRMTNNVRGNPEEVQDKPKTPVTEDPKIGLGDAFYQAIEAGQRAGKAIDSIELRERSEELQARAARELERGAEIERELSSVTEQRLFATLQSSNFALSSDEAQQVLERLRMAASVEDKNIRDRGGTASKVDTMIQNEIDSLKEAEITFSERLNQYEETDMEWNELLQRQEKVKRDLRSSEKAELDARRALERAQRMVAEAKANLITTSNELGLVEERVKRSALDMDKVTTRLSAKQESVRDSLRNNAKNTIPDAIERLTEDDLTSLRRQEIQLMGDKTQIQRMVARLQSRAQKLKNRARALERWQRNNNNPNGDNYIPNDQPLRMDSVDGNAIHNSDSISNSKRNNNGSDNKAF